MRLLKRLFAFALMSTILLSYSSTPVYAGGLLDWFGKKKMSAPQSYECFWDGDYFRIRWENIEGNGGYSVNYKGKTITATNNWFYIKPEESDINNGMLSGSISVVTKPSEKKFKNSDPIKMPYSVEIPDYSGVSCLEEACLLSKDKLVAYLKSVGFSPEIRENDDFVAVGISLKDDNNSGFWNGVGAFVGGWFSGSAEGNKGKMGDVVEYGIENGDSLKDKIAKGYEEYEKNAVEGAKEGAVDATVEYIFTDRNIHYTYYYRKGDYEKCSAQYMKFDYLKSGNAEPDELLETIGFDYDKDAKLYVFRSSIFQRLVTISCSSDDSNSKYKRWVCTYKPF